jgi:HD superfamily phosphohydrolase
MLFSAQPEYFGQTVEHPYFERLKRISQTNDLTFKKDLENGLNRFNHSIGTYLLTRDFLMH